MTERLQRAQLLLAGLDADALLVTSSTTRRYLSGFSAEDQAPDESSGVMLVDSTEATLFTASTNLPWAEAEANEGVSVEQAARPWTTTVSERILERRWPRVAFEDATTTVAVFEAIRSGVGNGVQLIPAGSALDDLRALKTADEVNALVRASQMTDMAFAGAMTEFRAGMSEREFANVIRRHLQDVGSEGEAFSTIVAAGPNAAKPHHAPGERIIVEGEPVIIDMGARYLGYNGDLTRTVWAGQPSERLGTIYTIVADAQRAALNAIGVGVIARDVDALVRERFDNHGMAEYFTHSLGHGLGLRVHEAPGLRSTSDTVLAAGHVVTVEPGLYIPEFGGVRIEDVVVLEDSGVRNITGAEKRAVPVSL